MNLRFRHILCLAGLLAGGLHPALGQVSVDRVDPNRKPVTFANPIKTDRPDEVEAFSEAKYRAERAAIRKQRNYLEMKVTLEGTLTTFNDPWMEVSGGDNSIVARGTFFLKHKFTKNKFEIETQANVKFGYNRMEVETKVLGEDGKPLKDEQGNNITTTDDVWFKNQDEFWIQTAPSIKFSKSWSYGALIKFRSQIANGYKSRTEQELTHRKSRFMSPGYFDLSGGINYQNPNKKFPIKINFSPIALNATFVENDQVRENGFLYGLPNKDRTSLYEGGSSIQVEFDRWFGNKNRKEIVRYRTKLYSFYGWISRLNQRNRYTDYQEYKDALQAWNDLPKKERTDDKKPSLALHPTVRWENTIDIKATKLLTTTIEFQLYYNRAQNLKLQSRTFLSVGLSYTFKNK